MWSGRTRRSVISTGGSWDTRMPRSQVLAEALALHTPLVLVTGGEPMLQPGTLPLLRELCDAEGCCLVVTTGGTGPALRDVTPEATEAVCDKMMPGFGELMRAVSLKVVPTAILSRQTAGIRGRSLVVNLPGKPSAIRDCLMAVFAAIPYCVDLIEGPYLTTNEGVVKAFRPKK